MAARVDEVRQMRVVDTGAVAFVLNMDSNGLGVARSLGRAGIPVIGVDHRTEAVGLRSRFCTPFVIRDPAENAENAVSALLHRARACGRRGVLFPTSDAYVVLVSRFRERLKEGFDFALCSLPVLENLMDKRGQYDAAARIGVPFPKTLYPREKADLDAMCQVLEFPLFLKPHSSHMWQARFKSKGFLVSDAAELRERFDEVASSGLAVMLQEVVRGPNTNHVKICAYFGHEGRELALFQAQKLRQFPTGFGVGTLMRSVHNAEVLELGLKFFRGIGYRGVGSIEFKKDDRDGKYKLIELNARSWQQNIQATRAGVNFPLVQYAELTGQEVVPALEWKDGIRWFDAIQDFQAFLEYHRQGKLPVGEWVRSWAGSEEFSYFAWDDPRPAWSNSEYGMKYLRLPLFMLRQRHRQET